MKRSLCLVLVTVLLLCCTPAHADRPVGGVRHVSLDVKKRGSQDSFISGPTVVTAGEEATWTIDLGENDQEYFYRYQILVDDDTVYTEESGRRLLVVVFERPSAASPTITYSLLYTPGNYQLWVRRYLVSDNTVYTEQYYPFTVVPCENGNAFDTRLDEIAAECRGEDDFDTVVNVFEWILANTRYDSSHRYYSAEAIIFVGRSTCNGYACLFRLLMERLNIPVRYVSGIAEDDDHAWNTVQIDGKWYNMDLTWCDGQSGVYYTYAYFGLPDDVMNLTHTAKHYAPAGPVTCTSMDSNYLVRTAQWQEAFPEVLQGVQEQLDAGHHRVSLELADEYGTGTDYQIIYSRVSAEGLSRKEWTEIGGQTCRGEFTAVDDCHITGRLQGEGLLKLPDQLDHIEDEAFRGICANYVTVPDSCTSIGDYAFYGSKIWEITIPDSVTDIGDHALDGNPGVLVLTPEDSPAAAWADSHGINHQADQ